MERKCIELTSKERTELEQFSTKGVHSVRLVNRAKIILALDTSGGRKAQKQEGIAKRVGVNRQTVNNAKNDFLKLKDVSLFLQRKKRKTPPVPPKVTGELEARIIALACSPAPQGCARWTLKLLADKCVELDYCGSISDMTIHRVLKKTNLSLI
jgi:hypothetical protein